LSLEEVEEYLKISEEYIVLSKDKKQSVADAKKWINRN